MSPINALVALVLVAACIALSACGPGSPEAAYADVVAASEEGDWEAVYDSFDMRTQARLDVVLEMIVGFAGAFGGEEANAFEGLSGRELFIAMASTDSGDAPTLVENGEYEVLGTERDGERAELEIRRGNSIQTVEMVLEEGAWKISLDLDESEEGAAGEEYEPEGESLSPAQDFAETEHLAELRSAADVVLLEKELLGSDYDADRFSDVITMDLEVRNLSESEIAGVKGVTVFKDIFGDEILRVSISIDESIPAGERLTWNGSLDFNEFRDDHRKLANTDAAKLEMAWEPELILFADGSRLPKDDG